MCAYSYFYSSKKAKKAKKRKKQKKMSSSSEETDSEDSDSDSSEDEQTRLAREILLEKKRRECLICYFFENLGHCCFKTCGLSLFGASLDLTLFIFKYSNYAIIVL